MTMLPSDARVPASASLTTPAEAGGPAGRPGARGVDTPGGRILVVDDELQIQRALKSILTARKYEVFIAGSGEEALSLAVDCQPQLVILDLAMPGMSGLETCLELRTWLKAPILVLSVHSGVEDKIAALDGGADDYLAKPFAAGELLARIRALLRRANPGQVSVPVLQIGNLEIDLARRRVCRGGEEITLTRTEFNILAFLAQKVDCVVTSKMLLQEVWGPAYGDDTQTLRVHIGHLRKKIEPHPSVPSYLLTEPGVGYRLTTGGPA